MKPFSNLPVVRDAALNPAGGAATNLAMTSLVKTSPRLHLLALAAALAVAGCSSSSGGSGDGSSAEEGTCKTGKEAAFANPAGTPLVLPAGVTIEGELTGDVDVSCKGKSYVEYGSDLILVCVGLKNSTTAEVAVTMPAGLSFIAKNPATQNGIILHSHVLKVPAGGVAHFYFRPFSLNRACGPGGADDRYTMGNVVTDPRIAEVISLAATKVINGDEGAYVLGQMLWDITDGDGITDEHRTQLKQVKDL